MFKYHTWFFDVELGSLEIPLSQLNFFEYLVEELDPKGTSVIEIQSRTRQSIELDSKESEFDRDYKGVVAKVVYPNPSRYEASLERINRLTKASVDKEFFSVVIKNEDSKCIFCGSKNLNREHIVSKWMRRYFKEEYFDTNLMLLDDDTNLNDSFRVAISKGKESNYGYVTKDLVCKNCNGGWICKLDDKVSNLMTDNLAFKSAIQIVQLEFKDLKTIIRWLIVKTILIPLKNNVVPSLPKNIGELLRNDIIDDRFIVEVTESNNYNLNFTFRNGKGLMDLSELTSLDLSIAEDLKRKFFVVSYQIGYLIFRISFWDNELGVRRETCGIPSYVLFPQKANISHSLDSVLYEEWKGFPKESQLLFFDSTLYLTDRYRV